MRLAEKLKISCLGIMLPLLGTAAAQDLSLEKIVAEESAIEQQTDTKEGPGWPDVSKPAEDRRTAALKALQVRLAALPPSLAGALRQHASMKRAFPSTLRVGRTLRGCDDPDPMQAKVQRPRT